MLNLKRKGCFKANPRRGTSYGLVMFYMLLASNPSENCTQKHANYNTDLFGGSIFLKIFNGRPRNQTWCAVPKNDDEMIDLLQI